MIRMRVEQRMKQFGKFLSMSMLLSLTFSLFPLNAVLAEEEKDPSDKNVVILNKEAQQAAGITIITLEPQAIKVSVSAPGEVIQNAKLTNKVTIRVASQVIKRNVQEGEHVKKNQIIATLSSVDMAKVQGDLLLASQEWQRVKSLGKEAISGKRYSEAQVAFQHAYSTALAYGLTEEEADELLRTQKPSQAKGDFNILAPRDGTIFNINFTEGELIEPGRILLQVVDESTVWIDAKLPSDLTRPVKVGDLAKVSSRNTALSGRVIQVHHQLDETTRTRSIRVEIPNANDVLHPGQYVNCQIEGGETAPKLALPVAAVLRTSDGDWAIYVEKSPDHFQQVKVKVVEVINNYAIIEGVPIGVKVVTNGAFFVRSELNKRGFDADGH